jgi:prepilin-type N-terminal cleavage/methylation domain-containing protein
MNRKNKIMTGITKRDKGFTMLEVIAVMVVLGIITAVVISRIAWKNEVSVRTEVATLKGHLRFAQYRAMNDISPVRWGIRVNGQTYTLVRNSSGDGTTFDSPNDLPGADSATYRFPGGITAAVTGSNPILFNDWGSPGTSAAIINVSGQSITITPNTGFIP